MRQLRRGLGRIPDRSVAGANLLCTGIIISSKSAALVTSHLLALMELFLSSSLMCPHGSE